MSSGARVGRPAPVALVASYFGAALLCWLAAAVALVAAAEQLANEGLASQEVLLAVHLVGLAFLPLAAQVDDPASAAGVLVYDVLPILVGGLLLIGFIASVGWWRSS